MTLLSLEQRPDIKFDLLRDFYTLVREVENPTGIHTLPLMEIFYTASDYGGRVYLSKRVDNVKILVLSAKNMMALPMGAFYCGSLVSTHVEKVPGLNYRSTAERIARIIRTGRVD